MEAIQQDKQLKNVIQELRRMSLELELERALSLMHECADQFVPYDYPKKKKLTKKVSWEGDVDDTAQRNSAVQDHTGDEDLSGKELIETHPISNRACEDRLALLERQIARIKEESFDVDYPVEPRERLLYPIVEEREEEEEEKEKNIPADKLVETMTVDSDVEQGNTEQERRRRRRGCTATKIFNYCLLFYCLVIAGTVLGLIYTVWKHKNDLNGIQIRPMNVFTRH